MNSFDDDWSQLSAYWRSCTTNVLSEEANSILRSLNIIGRRIKGIYSLDYCYRHSTDDIEAEAYRYYKKQHYSEEKCDSLSLFSSIPPTTPMLCYEWIDRPLRIQFEDGDILNIDTGYNGFKADLNGIAIPCQKNRDVDLNVLFCHCIGKEIIRTECKNLKSEFWDEEVGVTFFLSDKSKFVMSVIYDYTVISHEAENGEGITIPFEKLKSGLNFDDSEEN